MYNRNFNIKKNARGETQKEIYVSDDRKKVLKALK